MDLIEVWLAERRLAVTVLGQHAIEVGAASGCDLRVNCAGMPERALLVQPRAGSVWAHWLDPELGRGGMEHLAYDVPLRVREGLTILRRLASEADAMASGSGTARIPWKVEHAGRWLLLAADRGRRSCRVISEVPLTIGTGPGNRLVLDDETVSAHHCRLEPAAGGLVLRDLASTNGTYIGGVSVQRADVTAGVSFRVGRRELRVLPDLRGEESKPLRLVVRSPRMLQVMAEAERMACLHLPVLVSGETGAGKEGVARALHSRGGRRAGPFVAVNAGAFPADLIESELFGHEAGAFTGATNRRRGAIEQASGGTLFLDEIGEMSLDLQSRLLRVLDDGEVRRLGGQRAMTCDFRLVCATNRKLERLVATGQFREDLYFRINVLSLQVPPLRERPEDILALAAAFLSDAHAQLGPRHLSREAQAALLAHHWSGNVRELRNVVLASAAAISGPCIEQHHIHAAFQGRGTSVERAGPSAVDLKRVVVQCGGNVSAASRALGMPRTTLRDMMQRLASGPPPGD